MADMDSQNAAAEPEQALSSRLLQPARHENCVMYQKS